MSSANEELSHLLFGLTDGNNKSRQQNFRQEEQIDIGAPLLQLRLNPHKGIGCT